jgi:hypothetical protein
MTIKEATIAALQVPGYSDSAIEKALLDNGLNGNDVYNGSQSSTVNLVAVEVLKGMKAIASVTEGGYSVSYSLAGIESRLGELEGVEAFVQPKVTSPKNVW